MAQSLGVDYSFTHPNPAAIKGAGYDFVVRYLWPDPGKGLTAAERDALWAAGLGIRLVYEAGAQDALGGAPQGAADGHAANQLADALGVPGNFPIFYAVDFNEPSSDFPTTAAYLQAAALGGRPAGIYGSDAVVDAMVGGGIVAYGWQTEAWSGTTVSAHANLYQRVGVTRPAIPGGGYDENVEIIPMPLWTPGSVTPPTPTPKPTPTPAPPPAPHPVPHPVPVPPAHRNIFTPVAVDGIFGPASVKAEQFVSFNGNVADCDGVFGINSKRSMQAHLGVRVDGVIGPVTVRALQARVGAAQDGIWGNATTKALQTALNEGRY